MRFSIFAVLAMFSITKQAVALNLSPNRLLPVLSRCLAREVKMVMPSNKKLLRVERLLGNRGVGSRSVVSTLILQKRVKVDNRLVRSGSERFPMDQQEVRVDGKLVPETPLVALYHKPVGVLSSVGDSFKRPNLAALYDALPFLKTLHPVGRLDADTSGLLFFSSSGQITQTLLDPLNRVPRVYEAIVSGHIDEPALRQLLQSGVQTADGVFPAMLLNSISFTADEDASYLKQLVFDQYQQLKAFREKPMKKKPVQITPYRTAPIEDDHDAPTTIDEKLLEQVKQYSYLRMSVTEGKYRMVRRLLHNAGHTVLLLHRQSFGGVTITADDTVPSSGTSARSIWPPACSLAVGELRCGTEAEIKRIASLFK